jgi:hypothetical protein
MWALCAAGAGLSMFIKQCTSFEEFRFDLFVQKIQKALILHMSFVRAAKGRTTWTMDAQSHWTNTAQRTVTLSSLIGYWRTNVDRHLAWILHRFQPIYRPFYNQPTQLCLTVFYWCFIILSNTTAMSHLKALSIFTPQSSIDNIETNLLCILLVPTWTQLNVNKPKHVVCPNTGIEVLPNWNAASQKLLCMVYGATTSLGTAVTSQCGFLRTVRLPTSQRKHTTVRAYCNY